jgi:hypothetical protein
VFATKHRNPLLGIFDIVTIDKGKLCNAGDFDYDEIVKSTYEEYFGKFDAYCMDSKEGMVL